MKRARYRVAYKQGRERKTQTYIGTSAEVITLNEEQSVLEIRDELQTVLVLSFANLYICELIEYLGPRDLREPEPKKPKPITPKTTRGL